MSRHPCGSPLERSRPSRAETRGGSTLLRPATFSRCRQRQSHRRTADPTGAWFPKERPSRGSGGRHRVRWPWLPFGSPGNPRRVFSTRPAWARRPRRGALVVSRPGPVRRRARGAVALRMWPFVAFGRSTDARFGAAVRDGAVRPVLASLPPEGVGVAGAEPSGRGRVASRERSAGAGCRGSECSPTAGCPAVKPGSRPPSVGGEPPGAEDWKA
jgi:hypothetical protein